jgi:hypothetical protein
VAWLLERRAATPEAPTNETRRLGGRTSHVGRKDSPDLSLSATLH